VDSLDDLKNFADVLTDLYNKIVALDNSAAASTASRKNVETVVVERVVEKKQDVQELVAQVVKEVVLATHESGAEKSIGTNWIGVF